MSPGARILALPRELRDIIYGFYLAVEGGYSFNYQSGKLVTVEGQPIDLGLAYACKTTATEMRDLPLQYNTIHFSTVTMDSIGTTIGHFDLLMKYLDYTLTRALYVARSCIDEKVVDHVRSRYPQMLPIIQAIQRGQEPHGREWQTFSWGEVHSIYADFVLDTLRYLSRHANFNEMMLSSVDWRTDWVKVLIQHDFDKLLDLRQFPWSKPADMDTYSQTVGPMIELIEDPDWYEKIRVFRLSAAAASISFSDSLSSRNRRNVRKIVLHEDRVAVPWPEKHARGLIPWCVENPKLHIERRVNLWRSVWLTSGQRVGDVLAGKDSLIINDIEYDKNWLLYSNKVSRHSLVPWIMEALALPSFGMPAQAFTLVLDGSPTPEAAARVFEIVQRDAAWQEAFEEACARRNANPGSAARMKMRFNNSYIMNGFPEALKTITENASPIVSCNFDPGTQWDRSQLEKINAGWSMDEWNINWTYHEPDTFDTEPPLPCWFDIRCEEILPGEYGKHPRELNQVTYW